MPPEQQAVQPTSESETKRAGSAGRAKGATGKDSEATSVLAAEYFCLEPVVGRRPGHTLNNLNLHAHEHEPTYPQLMTKYRVLPSACIFTIKLVS